MRYVKEAPFRDRKGEQVVLPLNLPALNSQPPTREPTLGRIMHFLIDSYEPSAEFRISISDMKNKVYPILDILEQGPNAVGYFAFENEQFEALKRVVLFYAERAQGLGLGRHAPMLAAVLDEAGTSLDPAALGPAPARQGAADDGSPNQA